MSLTNSPPPTHPHFAVFLFHFLIGLYLFHLQTIISTVSLQGIELAKRLMAAVLRSLGLYKSALLLTEKPG